MLLSPLMQVLSAQYWKQPIKQLACLRKPGATTKERVGSMPSKLR